MIQKRTIDNIIIFSMLTIVILYIFKVSWSGLILSAFSLVACAWFLIREIKKRQSWTISKIISITLLVLIAVLALQTIIANKNNLLAICVTFTMYSLAGERFKSLSLKKKS
jgi:hypothetical protein